MRSVWIIAVVSCLALQASADTVRSNQQDPDNQSTTISSHAHGAPAKVVRPSASSSVNPVVVVTPPAAPSQSSAGR